MESTVVLLSTHIYNEFVEAQIIKLRNELYGYADVCLLCQTDNTVYPNIDNIEIYEFTHEELNNLGYKSLTNTIVPGSNHFQLLKYYKDHPWYEYYWNIEYDVVFSGNWKDFLTSFDDRNEDFISSHIQTIFEGNNWNRWSQMVLENNEIRLDEYVKSFNPIYRISNRALQFLDQYLLLGNYGHHELLIPTVLLHYKYTLLDMGGDGSFSENSRYKFYTNNFNNDVWYRYSSMRYRPLYSISDMKIPNMLYHPIKNPPYS